MSPERFVKGEVERTLRIRDRADDRLVQDQEILGENSTRTRSLKS
jgi:hypothetical protein